MTQELLLKYRAQVEEILRKAGTDVAFVVSFSGGKDSSAMLAWIRANYPQVKTYAVLADTGWEHEDCEAWSRGIVEAFGLELAVVRNERKDFFSMIRSRGMFPSASCRQCTSDLKRDPIYKWIRNNVSERVVINCLGIRADESASRAKMTPLKLNKRLSTKVGTRVAWDWFPIHHWTTTEVFGYLADQGVPVHGVYRWLPRFSCRVCVLMGDRELVKVLDHDPEAFWKMADLEEEIGYTMKHGRSLRDLAAEARLVELAA